jgi:hypothetical protein
MTFPYMHIMNFGHIQPSIALLLFSLPLSLSPSTSLVSHFYFNLSCSPLLIPNTRKNMQYLFFWTGWFYLPWFLAPFIFLQTTYLHSSFFFNFNFFIIHMCIQCLGHYSPLPPPSPLPQTLPLPSPSIPSRNYFALISNFVEERV